MWITTTPAWEQSGNDTNPATTLAFIQLVYPALVQMSQVLNVDAASRAQWNNIIARLTPLPIVPASSISSLNGAGRALQRAGRQRHPQLHVRHGVPHADGDTLSGPHVRSSSAGMSCPPGHFPGLEHRVGKRSGARCWPPPTPSGWRRNGLISTTTALFIRARPASVTTPTPSCRT